MTVDFEFKRVPSVTIASLRYVSSWNKKRLRDGFWQIDA
jgi:hypothetical protein